MTIKRQVSYQWRLREVMAAHGLFSASDLVPLLAERGITLPAVQVWRLVTQTPERLSLPVLAALCDILEVSPTQLIATRAENAAPVKKASSAGDGCVTDLSAFRPKPSCARSSDRRGSGAGACRLPPLWRHPARVVWPASCLRALQDRGAAAAVARRRGRPDPA
jgi:DNA-binding Xre family transcriptional regulator